MSRGTIFFIRSLLLHPFVLSSFRSLVLPLPPSAVFASLLPVSFQALQVPVTAIRQLSGGSF